MLTSFFYLTVPVNRIGLMLLIFRLIKSSIRACRVFRAAKEVVLIERKIEDILCGQFTVKQLEKIRYLAARQTGEHCSM